ncbi:hypothetical protein CCO0970 [Campylobacter coli RM2228]|nr:hypothetical protein CCO0970 [Campylobacter coli RM2228]
MSAHRSAYRICKVEFICNSHIHPWSFDLNKSFQTLLCKYKQ